MARGRKSDLHIVAGQEFRRVAKELRDSANKGLSADLRKRIRTIVKPIVQEVKANIRRMPVKGAPGGTVAHPRRKGAKKLRATIARGVGVRMATKRPSLRIISKVPDQDLKSIPRGLDTYKGSSREGFRHPVFGNENTEVLQKGRSWFREPIEDRREDVQRQVLAAIDDTLERIADKGT